MNPSMQSLGYGLAALLFCVGIYFLCQEIKSFLTVFTSQEITITG